MRISDWSSDVCSSDLHSLEKLAGLVEAEEVVRVALPGLGPLQRRRGAEVDEPPVSGLELRRRRAVEALARPGDLHQIGRAVCRESVCQYVLISGVAGSLNKKNKEDTIRTTYYQ